MRTLLERSPRYRSVLALGVALALGASACADVESREAPEGEAAAAASDRSAPETSNAAVVAEGTSMIFIVDQEISTDSHVAGDRFIANLAAPVNSSDGSTGLAAGTPSQWVVTQSTTEDGRALLAFELESIEVDGAWTPAPATVTHAELDTDNADSDSETAAKIGVGAAAGAIVGQILGKDTESTLTGAGVGAAVGTAVALSTKGGSATLPAGSALTVKLEEPLPVS